MLRARGVLAVQLTDLEADAAIVGAHGVPGLVHPGADGDDAAERALLARYRGHAVVVDAVLEVHHHAVGLAEVLDGERGGPLGVVGLHRHEGGLEGLGDLLQLVDVDGVDGDQVLAAGAGQAQAVLPHVLHVLRPLVGQGHVVARFGEEPAHHAADGARADDADPHVEALPRPRATGARPG